MAFGYVGAVWLGDAGFQSACDACCERERESVCVCVVEGSCCIDNDDEPMRSHWPLIDMRTSSLLTGHPVIA